MCCDIKIAQSMIQICAKKRKEYANVEGNEGFFVLFKVVAENVAKFLFSLGHDNPVDCFCVLFLCQ